MALSFFQVVADREIAEFIQSVKNEIASPLARNDERGISRKDGFLELFCERIKVGGLVKSRIMPFSRHSGSTGILLIQCVIRQNDSRQAGMTTFYECIKVQAH